MLRVTRVSSLNMDQSCNMDHRHNSLEIAASEIAQWS